MRQESLYLNKQLKPAFTENSIPVVFAADNNFVPIFATCFQSLIENTSKEFNYDIILIESDISQINKEKLLSMVQSYTNISLRYYNANGLIKDYNLKANAHISKETYFRFLIQRIVPDYEKVLYLDCDIIVNFDVAQLYCTDITGYMIAAVYDAEFLGNVNGASRVIQKYAKSKLKMKDPYNYFQAGVLLFNENEMRKAYSLDEWLTFAQTPYKYNDQDVLNIYCEGRVKYLDMRWNFITDCDHTRVSNIIIHAPEDIQNEYNKAAVNPKIIHYAGHIKPWQNPTEDKAEFFWEYARKTEFYELLLWRMMNKISETQIIEYREEHSFAGKLRTVMRKILDCILPKGSKQRDFIKRIIGR